MYHDLSDLGSLILIQITPKKCTPECGPKTVAIKWLWLNYVTIDLIPSLTQYNENGQNSLSKLLIKPQPLNGLAITDIADKEHLASSVCRAGYVQVMENLESHGILQFHFPGLESPEI